MKTIGALMMLLALSACSLPVFYRVPIVQGNTVTAGQVAKLKKGMTKKQVAYVLGTPLIKSPFEKNRWDYVFYYRNPKAHVRESKLDLYFVNGKLAHIAGNREYGASLENAGQNSTSTSSIPLPGESGSLNAPRGAGPGSAGGAASGTGTAPSRPRANQSGPSGRVEQSGRNGAGPSTGPPTMGTP